MVTNDILAAITAAAADALPIRDIPSTVGLTDSEWLELVRQNREDVRLAITKGRTAAFVANAEALWQCVRFGSADAALFILQRDHGWPKPKRGRPRKIVVSVDLPPP